MKTSRALFLLMIAGSYLLGCDSGMGEQVDTTIDEVGLDSLSECTAIAWCANGTQVSCLGDSSCDAMDFDGDPNRIGWVECDGTKTYCGGGSSGGSSGGGTGCPGVPQIHEYLHPCYPSVHPHGRYGLVNADTSATYKWSGTNVTFTSGTTGTYVIVKPTSVGGYTLTVTATKYGCTTVKKSVSYYAESCNGVPEY